MNRYYIELQKSIVVEVDAETEAEARAKAVDPNLNTDGAWDKAEPFEVIVQHSEPTTL